jgi:hypothetical protein
MELIIDKLKALQNLTDRAEYHPEQTVLKHIKIVTLRAHLVSGHPDLILAGLLHDICKGDAGDNSKGYWSNPDHPKQAFEFCYLDDVRYFIKQFGGNVDHVANICLYHMACKEFIIKKAQKVPFMDLFVVLDDMMERKPFPKVRRNLWLPWIGGIDNANLYFVGQSPLQQMRNIPAMTVTVNNTPFVAEFDKIHQFGGIFELFKF